MLATELLGNEEKAFGLKEKALVEGAGMAI